MVRLMRRKSNSVENDLKMESKTLERFPFNFQVMLLVFGKYNSCIIELTLQHKLMETYQTSLIIE